jgi:hypothetical protein
MIRGSASKVYRDKAQHAACGRRFWLVRRISSAGRIVNTYCPWCGAKFKMKAGRAPGMPPTMNGKSRVK